MPVVRGTAPFTELDEPVPISPYGHAKLATERALGTFVEETGHVGLIARIANLYRARTCRRARG